MGRRLRYSQHHIWAEQLEGNWIRMGMSAFAVRKLGEIIQLELPEAGERVRAGQSIGTVESAKTVSDIYCPVNGIIIEINPLLKESAPGIYEDPLDQGWIAIMEMSDPHDWEKLMGFKEYMEWMEE